MDETPSIVTPALAENALVVGGDVGFDVGLDVLSRTTSSIGKLISGKTSMSTGA